MNDNNQKERLEQELRFLRESFEAEVISKEEYEKGKDRVEKKLDAITSGTGDNAEEPSEQNTKDNKEVPQEAPKSSEPVKTEEAASAEVLQPKEKLHQNKDRKEGKFFKYAIVFVVLALLAFFVYSFVASKNPSSGNKPADFTAACSSDADCSQTGKHGLCIEPKTKNSRCEFTDIKKTNVIVLNGRNECFNCEPNRVLAILEGWFGPINAKEVNYYTEYGRNLSDAIGVRTLPSYILNENISKLQSFADFGQAFAKKGNMYILKEDAAASTFYFKRENVPNKIELFAKEGESAKAESNLKQFLDNFDSVIFEKHLATDPLTQELGIKTFPTFLVNNRVKFTGVQSAETIKENFCSINKLKGCEIQLSRSLT